MSCRCGGTLTLRARAGRRIPYKVLPLLALPADLALPTCGACGKVWVDPADRQVARALEGAYGQALRRLAPGIVESAAVGIGQAPLERTLGLSQGYLSRLGAQDGTPSTALLALLHLLGLHPELRADVERLWSTASLASLRKEQGDDESSLRQPA